MLLLKVGWRSVKGYAERREMCKYWIDHDRRTGLEKHLVHDQCKRYFLVQCTDEKCRYLSKVFVSQATKRLHFERGGCKHLYNRRLRFAPDGGMVAEGIEHMSLPYYVPPGHMRRGGRRRV